MPTIVHTLGEEDPEDWERLHGVYQNVFLFGECYAFALALNQGLGWPMVSIMKDREVCHVGVRTPDGEIRDIRGIVSEEEFGRPYSCPLHLHALREVRAEELYAIRPISDHMVGTARRVAEVLWPELPWKKTLISRLTLFADELEELCRRHRIWIRAPFPIHVPVLAKGEDDEGGYELHPTIDGFSYTINRYLTP